MSPVVQIDKLDDNITTTLATIQVLMLYGRFLDFVDQLQKPLSEVYVH